MNMKIGHQRLGERPLIAGVLTDAGVDMPDNESIKCTDIIELRVDMFKNLDPDHIVNTFKLAKEKFHKPIIGTVRDISEGAKVKVPDRLQLYKIIAPLSDALDVEIQQETTTAQVKKLCIANKILLIGSYHNFTSTPQDIFLDSIELKGRRLGADIVKVATTASMREDLIRVATFTLKHRHAGVIAIAMGEAGLPSRVFSPVFGSLITYAYINEASAPGQFSACELFDIFKKLHII
ncbi:MAG: type I 3-dehydroquinate dehydratase [Nitrospiraceae bacterium]|nr:type I 3-dehydroquinate dehydratase [Nitrospiraceae bacterium]